MKIDEVSAKKKYMNWFGNLKDMGRQTYTVVSFFCPILYMCSKHRDLSVAICLSYSSVCPFIYSSPGFSVSD